MALNAAIVWEVRTSGNAANAGGFKAGATGTDYSQQDSPQVTIDGATITATVHSTTTQLNIVGYTVAAGDVGNTVRIAGGTMTAGTYEITVADAVNNRWTLDRSGGTAAQTGTGRMGGAQSDPALVASLLVSTNTVWQKAGTYSITSASTNVSGGCVSVGVTRVRWEGYQTTRGDLGTRPVLLASGISTATLFSIPGSSGNDCFVANIDADGASLTSIRGFAANSGARMSAYLCRAFRCTNNGFLSAKAIRCRASECSTAPAFISNTVIGSCILCEADANTVTAFQAGTSGGSFVVCLAWNNTGASSDGFDASSSGNSTVIHNCTSVSNGRDGVNVSTAGTVSVVNTLSEGNGRYGFNPGLSPSVLLNCGGYNNTSGNVNGTPTYNLNFVTGAGSFFVDAASGNLALNNTAGAGAAARAAGSPGTFPSGLTATYRDIGAAQHADPAVSAGGAWASAG